MDWYAERGDPSLERSEPSEGVKETFDDFYAREFWAIVGLAYALSGSRSGAEDLAQEAFLAAHRSWDRVGGYADPGAWVRRVVSNMSVSAFRRRLVEAKALARFPIRSIEMPELPEDGQAFWMAVRTLPRRQRQVIALRYVDDLSVADIASILGTAEGTVKRHLHDARATLSCLLALEEGT